MVPNQPLVFNSDGKPRTEDDLLAYGWVKFMETGDPIWIAAVADGQECRAGDGRRDGAPGQRGGRQGRRQEVRRRRRVQARLDDLADRAVDKRVVAIVPIVIDVVNVQACSINHFCRLRLLGAGGRRLHAAQDLRRRGTPEYDALHAHRGSRTSTATG